MDQDVGSGLFFRIWIRFDRDTKMFNLAPLLFLIRPRDVFLRRLVRFNRFSDVLRIWILVVTCRLRSDTNVVARRRVGKSGSAL